MALRLAVISDEVSQDWSRVLQFCQEFDCGVELRSVTCGLVGQEEEYKNPFVLPFPVAQGMRYMADEIGVPVIGIASPFLKCGWDDKAAIVEHLEGLKHCLNLADLFHCDLVRVFNFLDPQDPHVFVSAWHRALAIYREEVPRLLDRHPGIRLGLENEFSTVGRTAKLAAQFVAELNDPRVGIIWDPANEMFARDGVTPFPDGWVSVLPYVIHVHAKDAIGYGAEAKSVEFGRGEIDWKGQLNRLVWMKPRYSGIISLETHWRTGRKLDAATTHQPGGAAFTTPDTEESTRICMPNLVRMLKEAQTQ